MNKSVWLIASLVGAAALTACNKQEGAVPSVSTPPPAAVTPAPSPAPAAPATTPAPAAPAAPAATPGTPAPDSQAALDEANKAITDGQAALAKGDFAAYGTQQTKLSEALKKALDAEARLGATPAPAATPSATPSPSPSS